MAHYFLTGATGVVGSAFLTTIAPRQHRITLLLRAATGSDAQNRLKRLLSFCNIAPAAAGHIDAIPGDLYRPELGLDKTDYRRIATQCTHYVHCAGNVHMNLPLPEARRQTLAMTEGILALLERSTMARKMEFVSTVGVSGHTPGEIAEAWIDHPRRFHNTYEAAKAEAEEIVRRKIAAGMPITVNRPSMVVGDSRTGKTIAFQVFYYLCEFLSGARSKGLLPNVGGMRLDIVPADYVAAVLDWSSKARDHGADILHACSGRQGSISLQDLIRRVRQIFLAHGRRLPRSTMLPLPVFQLLLRLVRPTVSPKNRRALDALPYFLAYLKEDQSFANDQTLKMLGADGIALPKVEDYLERVLGYYLSR